MSIINQHFGLLGFISIIMGSLGAYVIMKWGRELRLLDVPKSRSSHSVIIPKGGGVGILVSFIIVSLYFRLNWMVWLSALLISILSFLGDRIDFSPKARLLLHFFFSGMALSNINITKFTYINAYIDINIPQFIVYLVLLFFIVGTANFYNFMDGINGIAAITGVIAFGLIGFVSYINNESVVIGNISFCVACACLGFLPFNFPKAKVFMEDVGSVLLGFLFAIIVLEVSDDIVELICYSAFILPYYFDELSTMIERLIDKEALTQAHRRHLYQILANERIIPHWKVALGYGLVQILISVIILFWLNRIRGSEALLGIVCIYFVSFFIFLIVVCRIKKGLVKHGRV